MIKRPNLFKIKGRSSSTQTNRLHRRGNYIENLAIIPNIITHRSLTALPDEQNIDKSDKRKTTGRRLHIITEN